MTTAMRTSSSPCTWTPDGSAQFWRQKRREPISLPCFHLEDKDYLSAQLCSV